MNPPHPARAARGVRAAVLALAAGAAGGAVFALLGSPMPWLLGAISASAAAALARVPVHVPGWLRDTLLVVIGLMVGSSLHGQSLAYFARWPISLAAVALYVLVVTSTLYLFLRRVGGFDPVTAYFAAAPGGFMAMTTVGRELGGRERSIALAHSVRVVVVVFSVIFGYHALLGSGNGAAQYVPLEGLGAGDLAAFALLGAAGAGLARVLRVPGPFILGPMLFSAAAHLSGLLAVPVPTAPILVAEVVIGSSIGADFAGASAGELGRGLAVALAGTLYMLLLALLFAISLVPVTGVGLGPLFLAFAPGGLSGVSLIALALDLDPAFVAVHNLLRVILVIVAAPMVFRVVAYGRGTGGMPKNRWEAGRDA